MALKKTATAIAKTMIPSWIVRQRLNKRGHGALLLTFDDGPTPGITPRVLDLLDRWDARAMFFVVGERVAKAPDMLKEILGRGHRVGNHTYSHLTRASFRQYVDDIRRCQDVILEMTGQRSRFFRPPHGRMTFTQFSAVKYCKLVIVRWSFDTGEYSYLRDATPKERAENLIRKIEDRAIVLSHDDTEKTVEMLEVALPRLSEQGVELRKGVDCLD